MKHIAVLLVLAILFTTCFGISAFATYAEIIKVEPFDFRNTRWGMSMEEVLKSEAELIPYSANETTILYKSTLLNRDIVFGCDFENNELVSCTYILTEKHSNTNLYYRDYEYFAESYIEKYGEPTANSEIWFNSLFKDDLENIGLAISAGHAVFGKVWETETTKITLLISGDNYQINLLVLYRPINYEAKKDASGI